MLPLPQGSKPSHRWNCHHFWHQGISLSLASPRHYKLSWPPISTHPSHRNTTGQLPPRSRSLALCSFLCSVIKKQTNKLTSELSFSPGSSEEAHGEDPATMKSDWVHKIQRVMSQARKVLPCILPFVSHHWMATRTHLPAQGSRQSAELPLPYPGILPLHTAAPLGTSQQSVPQPTSHPESNVCFPRFPS